MLFLVQVCVLMVSKTVWYIIGAPCIFIERKDKSEGSKVSLSLWVFYQPLAEFC
jgi:hypothetical protein